ncbi:NUDIX domain-containing protein [Actinacidiphila sp. bgisy167]|uniref:NUDIX domain-containing protein n=1 Tax=Actinacidiphila sp. bgisy167 TaxID=3413797 RepID=UPI003D7662FA
MTTADYAAYIAGLPKILAGASTLFRDAEGRILIAETTYRDDGRWVLPGGTIESADGETPREAARRETLEEIGLDVEPGVLLAVDWVHGSSERPPLASYMYDGGVLDAAALGAIVLQEEELSAWRTATPDEAGEYLSPGLHRRVLAALAALENGAWPVELVDGHPAAAAQRSTA